VLKFINFAQLPGDNITKAVNSWLENNPNIDIVSINQSSGGGQLQYSILYREKKQS